jgi:hypothetical protein
MQTVKKQLTSFALLLLVALPLIFSVCLFVSQKIVQSQREERFETEQLQTVVIAAEKISLPAGEKEILIDGKLFDVESVKKVGKTLVITGFFDGKEDKIAKNIKRVEQHKNNTESPFSQSTIKFLFSVTYTNQQDIIYHQLYWKFISKQYYSFIEMIPAAPAYPLLHPPC